MLFIVTDSKYKHEALLDGEPILFEILDTCPKVSKSLIKRHHYHHHISWNRFTAE